MELGESKREGNQEPSIPAARGRFVASPPRGAGPRVCRDGHPPCFWGRAAARHTRHRQPKSLVPQVTPPSPPNSLWGKLLAWPRPLVSTGVELRVGWMSPPTPLQPQICPSITSTPRRYPAPYPSTMRLPGAGYDPRRGAQSQAQHRSGTPPAPARARHAWRGEAASSAEIKMGFSKTSQRLKASAPGV